MARIPQNEIERLKNDVAVERLVEASGIELKRSGKDLLGRCPFHADDTASLVVTPSKNLWHCFGCQVGGGPIDWVMKQNGVSFRHAVELLREGVSSLAARGNGAGGGVGDEKPRPIKRTTVRALPAPVAFDADDQQLMNDTVAFYHERLKQSPQALAYLETRGIASPQAIDTFKLGFADRSLGLRLPDKRRKEGQAIRERLERIGLFRASGHEHFNGSLVVPVFDEQGNVVEIYGRKLLDNLRAGTPKHLYLPAREGRGRGVWNWAALQASKEIILCEALIDALTFWCAGYRHVTSSYGIEGFTEEHLAACKRFGTQRILIAYDRDEAGEKAAQKLAQRLMTQGIECFRIQFPKGMDANEYALKVTPAAKSLGVAIRKAVWLGKGQTPAPSGVAPVTMAAKDEISAPVAGVPGVPSLAAAVADAAALSASPVPAATVEDVPCEVKNNEITFMMGEGQEARRYRVRGLAKNLSFELLKVNLLAARVNDPAGAFYVDTLDLYSAKQRSSYITHAALELQVKDEILKSDLGRVLMRLEALQEANLTKTLETAPTGPKMSETEREAALELLRAPDLVERILAGFDTCALVGERTNKLVGYLAAVSRKLPRPLGVVIQSSSAAGKTTLLDAVLAFVPEEDKIKYSAMTGQSLFYMGEANLKHKALALVEEEGASRASYALKLLQSEGELTIASTGKDSATGNLVTQQYKVEGPVALLLTTTARDLDEELMNRCLVLAVDEGREQTRAIHQLQRARRTLEGLSAQREREALGALHQNAQRLLRPLEVLNPYANFLSFPDQSTRLRRDHEKYLTLIDTIAFLHQYQREVKTLPHRGTGTHRETEYIEVTLEDIALANEIAHEVLGRSLDELPPQTRRLLELTDRYVAGECERQAIKRSDFRFSRRGVRQATGLSDTQSRLHLQRLTELEYLLVHRGMRGQSFEYELLYDGAGVDERPFVPGLIDVAALEAAAGVAAGAAKRASTTGSSRGETGHFAGASRPQRAAGAGHSRNGEPAAAPIAGRISGDLGGADNITHLSRPNGKSPSYPQSIPLAAVSLAPAS